MKETAKGFTLVELLIVISIIAVLSMVGITLYSGVQKNARDARRRADIDAIANALEVAKTGATYQDIDGTKFASGVVPVDKGNSSAGHSLNIYCIYSRSDNTRISNPNPADWPNDSCPIITGATADRLAVDYRINLVDNATDWNVCAALENISEVYCRSSQQ